jgi:N-acetylated-alpha-linked acidic dipeptidase
MGRAPGDPSTPGFASPAPGVDEPRRVDTAALDGALPRLLCHPIGADLAQLIRAHLVTRTLPDATEASPVGPGPAEVLLDLDLPRELGTIVNVVARMEGRDGGLVLAGSHRDAWVRGAQDSGSGCVSLLLAAEELGRRARDGWKPEHGIALAFWDAEEFGLVGSTEYAEDQRARLQEQLIMYVNIDMYMKGRFDPGGVPSLRAFVADVAMDVPQGSSTVFEDWRQSEWHRLPAAARESHAVNSSPGLKPLGSGADFVPFQDHLGVPTLAIEFIGDNGYGYGTYHTNYDSRAYVEKIADPGFEQGVLMARVLGTMALRMSEATVVPFRFSDYAINLQEAIGAAEGWAGEAGATIDLAGLRSRAAAVHAAATSLEGAIDRRLLSGDVPSGALPALNDRLARMEQRLTDDDGAAESKWYRHVFYGWNIYSLYDGQPFPGLAEALRLKDTGRISHEMGRIERALDRMKVELNAALALVQ